MKESPGKKVARERLYQSLRDWLTEEQILSGKFLVLLGEDVRELPFLDALGIPRDRITCVEREQDVFAAICARAQGVHVTMTDVTDFLDTSLHEDNRFLVLNLDIEGQYRMQLDPAMSSVLLYCCRNPQTVVATYNTIGRDLHTIWEGAASLATLLWIDPQMAEHLLSKLTDLYKVGAYENPVKCALRDLFWLRSLTEHTLRVSAVVSPQALDAYRVLTQTHTMIWNLVRESGKRHLRLSQVRTAAAAMVNPERISALTEPCIHVLVPDQRHVIYKAAEPWSQRCYFNRFHFSAQPLSVREWLSATVQAFLNGPFEFVDREGRPTMHTPVPSAQPMLDAATLLEDGPRIFAEFDPRVLPDLEMNRWTKTIQRIHLDLQLEREGMPKKKAPAAKAKAAKTNEIVDRTGTLTSHGRAEVRRLASEGLDTSEILSKLKLGVNDPNAGSIRAMIAHARRPAGFAAGTNGKLSDYGHTFIAGLLKHGKTFEEVDAVLHPSIDRDEARKSYNKAGKTAKG